MEKNFEFLNLEELKAKVQTIEKEDLEKKEEKLEVKRELIKEEIKKQILKFQQKPSFAPPPSKIDEVKELENLERDQQIGALIEITLEKGLEKGVALAQALAKKLNNPALLDEYHDVLVDRYFEILVEKGILKLE
jgi:hypothetical protein